MSDKTRREARFCSTHKVWKVTDDRSGFVEYSCNMVIDHKGRVTLEKYRDPVHPMLDMPPPPVPEDIQLPFTRPDPLKGMEVDD